MSTRGYSTNLTAKQKSVDSLGLPSILNCMKAAAWPSIGWDTFRSTEYSCMAPTTRFWSAGAEMPISSSQFCDESVLKNHIED